MRLYSPSKKDPRLSINKDKVAIKLFTDDGFDKSMKKIVSQRLKEILHDEKIASETAVCKYPEDDVEHLLKYFSMFPARKLILEDIDNMLLNVHSYNFNDFDDQNTMLKQLAESLLDENDTSLLYISKNLIKVFTYFWKANKRYFTDKNKNYSYYRDDNYSYGYVFKDNFTKKRFLENMESAMRDQGIYDFAELSRRTGIKKSTFSKLSPGAKGETNKITKATMDKLTQVLLCSTDWLLGSGSPYENKHSIRKYGPRDSLETINLLISETSITSPVLVKPYSYLDPDMPLYQCIKNNATSEQLAKINTILLEIDCYENASKDRLLDIILSLLKAFNDHDFDEHCKLNVFLNDTQILLDTSNTKCTKK